MTAPPRVPTVLDAALGTRLAARGVDLSSLAAAGHAPVVAGDAIAAVHREDLQAGAQVITAATTCTHGYWDATGPDREGARRTTAAALAWAVRARAELAATRVAIAGSIAPLGPHARTPDARRAGYLEHAARLVDACDVLLVETMTDPDDAALAVAAAVEVAGARPVWLSFAAGPAGTMLGGAQLDRLADAVPLSAVAVLLVNCTPVSDVAAVMPRLARCVPKTVALGAYPSRTSADDETTLAGDLADLAARWGLAVVGGCCGTTATLVAALVARVHAAPGARELGFVPRIAG